MVRVIQCSGVLDNSLTENSNLFFPLWEAYPLPNAVLFHKLFFHKVFGVQRRGEQQSSPVAFNNTMATIQLQTSAGIGWSFHTLAPGAARSVCVCVLVCVCVCVCGWERGRGWERLLLVAALLEAWHDENQKALTCNRVRRKIIKMVSGQKPLHKIQKLLVWQKTFSPGVKFKVQSTFKEILGLGVGICSRFVRKYVRSKKPPHLKSAGLVCICVRQTKPRWCSPLAMVTHVFAYD